MMDTTIILMRTIKRPYRLLTEGMGMEILAVIVIFVIGALIAAAGGDFSGVGFIGKVILFFILWFGTMYTIAACMGAFD